jgi:hypothetical protein
VADNTNYNYTNWVKQFDFFPISGFFPPTSAAAAYLGPPAPGLGGKLPQPPPPHHLAAMYPNFLGAPPGLPAHLGGHPRLDMPPLGGNPPGSQPPSDHNIQR